MSLAMNLLALVASKPIDRPLDDLAPWHAPNWPRTVEQITWGFVALGLLLRVARYLLCFPLWGDESFLASNFIDRGYFDLLGRLEYNMVAPPLFLWAELAAVRLFGFNELALRLVPMLCSVTTLFLFRHLAVQLLKGTPLLLAVGIFSVAYYPIRHGCEVKPYATDLFVTLVLLTMAVQWLRNPQRLRWLWALAAMLPLALGFSFTAVFVAGGVAVAIGMTALTLGERRVWTATVAYGAVLLLSFAAFYHITARVQFDNYERSGLKQCWINDFPPLGQPLELAGWLVERHTSHMFAYPFGGAHGGSTLTAICIVAATVFLWRRRQHALLAMFFVPLALCFVAAALEKYPYGGSQRTMQFVAPMACLLSGLGMTMALATLGHIYWRHRAIVIYCTLLGILGMSSLARDLVHPYKTIYDLQAREFARWFWAENARDAELVCVKRDLGEIFTPMMWEFDRSAVYQCNQAIYSRRHKSGHAPELDAISSQHPLRCVLYNENPVENPKFVAWLDEMQSTYQLREVRQFEVNSEADRPGYVDTYVVYEFVPKDGPIVVAELPAASLRR